MPDRYVARLAHEHVRQLRESDTPPDGCTSWVDYATRHVHAGAVPCWQCVARERALAELSDAEEELDLMTDDCVAWQIEAEDNRAAYAEAMIRASKLTEALQAAAKLIEAHEAGSSVMALIEPRAAYHAALEAADV